MSITSVKFSSEDEVLSQPIVLNVDLNIYPKEALMRAMYWLDNEATISVNLESENQAKVSILPKMVDQNTKLLEEKFLRNLTDFTCRIDIENRTNSIREAIWKTAFHEVKAV